MIAIRDKRTCPICGNSKEWKYEPVWHYIGGDKYVHMRGRFWSTNGGFYEMVCILKNGKAMQE